MNSRCESCDGPKDVGPIPSLSWCGYCTEVALARSYKRDEFGALIALMFFQKREIRMAGGGVVDLTNAIEIAKVLELDPYEKAAELWNRVGVLPEPLRGLDHLRKLDGFQEAIEIVDRTSEYLALRKILDNNPDEAEVCRFIDERQFLLRSMLGGFHCGETAYCLKEFRFGSEFRADFVLITPRRSLPPKLYFVEFEPANDPVFTRKGTPSQRLLGAMKQIREWLVWTQTNSNYFHESIMQSFGKMLDPIYLSSALRRGTIEIENFIVIGRRLPKNRDHRGLWFDRHLRLSVHSHDTLLDIANEFDSDKLASEADWRAKMRIREFRLKTM